MCIELKIKSKHLALEPQIIRCEERKLKKRIKYTQGQDSVALAKLQSLSSHRRWEVRNEARATHLARAFLAGKPYQGAELKRKPCNEPMFKTYILPRVHMMVRKYGTREQQNMDISELITWAKQ